MEAWEGVTHWQSLPPAAETRVEGALVGCGGWECFLKTNHHNLPPPNPSPHITPSTHLTSFQPKCSKEEKNDPGFSFLLIIFKVGYKSAVPILSLLAKL